MKGCVLLNERAFRARKSETDSNRWDKDCETVYLMVQPLDLIKSAIGV